MKKELMSWEECQARFIREVGIDPERVKSILKLCSVRLRVVKVILLDEETASIIAESYYEIIKELLTALALLFGIKSDNHECLIAFLKKRYPEKEYEINIIFILKGVRNKVDYEGLFIEKKYIQMNKLEFEHIIAFLIQEIEEKL